MNLVSLCWKRHKIKYVPTTSHVNRFLGFLIIKYNKLIMNIKLNTGANSKRVDDMKYHHGLEE